MKKKFTKRLLSWVMAAAMVISMLPISAMATGTGGNVAKIGDTQYATLDDAVAAAADGATIELLADATTNGLNLSKNLTIQAADGLSEKPTVTFTQYGIALWGKVLTFKDINVVMKGIGSTPYTAEWSWMTICASVDASLTLDNVDMTMDATGVSNSPHAIYFCKNNMLNVKNDSNLTIKNYPQDALEWDGGNGGYNVNITESTFVSDHNRSGFTGTFYATITNSKVDVINSTGNGSNGSHFIIKDNSQVNFSNNGSHGLSAGQLEISNSTVTTKNNHGMGIAVNNQFIVKNSDITVTGNADNKSYGYAAVRLYNDCESSVDAESTLHINNNNNTGLYVRQGSLTVAEGADLEIMNNKVGSTLLDGYGGGVYVGYGDNYDPTVVLPSDAKIYNNHSLYGGDDIYVSEGVKGPSLTFGDVGEGWSLDGKEDGLDCNGEADHLIDGWYYDQSGNRWNAEETDRPYYVKAYDFGEEATSTVTGLIGLKAAHGMDPVKKTSYPGLEKFVKDTNEPDWNEDVNAAAGQEVQFKLESNVPEDLINYLEPEDPENPTIVEPAIATFAYTEFPVPEDERGEYILTFHDVMDSELTLKDGSFEVYIGNTKLNAEDYEIVEKKEHNTCTFEIQLDLVELYTTGKITGTDIENATKIIVEYTATLNGTVTNGTFENEAWVTYEGDGESAPDDAFVKTYAINIFKFEQDTEKPLAGAKFELYQKDAETGEAINVITLTSGDNGYVMQGGLDVGTYYLKEVEAPNGYVCSTEELEIIIPDRVNGDNIASVRFANSLIPHTGGMGTTMFSIVGGALIATAGVIFVISRKKRAHSAA